MGWIDLAQNRDWQAFVNVVMNLLVPQNVGNFLTTETWIASQEGLCSMALVMCCLWQRDVLGHLQRPLWSQ